MKFDLTDIEQKMYDLSCIHPEFSEDVFFGEITKLREYNVVKDLYAIFKKQLKPGNKNTVNSWIGYYLGLTTVRPTLNLFIEKRRTYARVGFPDIDMDFDWLRRHEIMGYIFEKYGKDKVGNVGTTHTLKTRAAIQYVIKVLDPTNTVRYIDGKVEKSDTKDKNFELKNIIVKTLPGIMKTKDGRPITNIKAAYDLFGEFRRYMDAYPEVYKYASIIEGTISASGAHASGIVISDTPLQNICPLHITQDVIDNTEGNKEKTIATQFAMGDVESLGLVKFDVLGLSTRTAVSWAVETIKNNTGEEIDVSRLPLDDRETLKLLNSGYTDGCFQLENYGMKKTLSKIKIDKFDDLMVAIAMYRPGPMQFIDDYAIKKRNASSIKYIHPIVQKHTMNTYSYVVYQEQCMNIFVELAGLTPSEGYVFIKGAAKKKPELFQSMKQRFIDGATRIANKEIAISIWNQLEPFQGYAFNASVSHDTVIRTLEKDIPIQKLYNIKCKGGKLPLVYGADGDVVEIKNVFDHGLIPTYEINFHDGSFIKCSLEHKFLTNDGVLPLWKIIKRKLSIIKNTEVKNARKKELGMCRLSYDFIKSSAIRFSQKELYEISCNKVEICLPGMSSIIHKKEPCHSQKRMREVENIKEPALFERKRIDCSKILGRYQKRSRSYCGIQKQNVKIGFCFNSFQSRRTSSPFFFDDKIKQRLLFGISAEPIRNRNQNIFQKRSSIYSSRTVKKMERRKPRRIYRKMYSTIHDKRSMALKTRKSFKVYSHVYGLQIFSNYKKQTFYFHVKKKTNRFYGHKSENYCRIRRRTTFQKRSKLFEFGTYCSKRQRGKFRDEQKGILGYSYVLRFLGCPEKNIQKSVYWNSRKYDIILSGKRSSKKNWQEVRVSKIKYIGLQHCYDLEVNSTNHLYCLPSGIIISNSHAASYAYESFKTAYLKAHYPTEFFEARLSVENIRRNFDDVDKYEEDAIKNWGFKILPPDLNKSGLRYTIVRDKVLRRPLLVKGIGVKAVEEIVSCQPFDNSDLIYSFLSSMKKGERNPVTTRFLEALWDAGLWREYKSKNKLIAAHEKAKKDLKVAKRTQTDDMFG